jgi:hypothetical protein
LSLQHLDIFARPGTEIIQHSDVMSLLEQCLRNVRANETSTTSDQIFHAIFQSVE